MPSFTKCSEHGLTSCPLCCTWVDLSHYVDEYVDDLLRHFTVAHEHAKRDLERIRAKIAARKPKARASRSR